MLSELHNRLTGNSSSSGDKPYSDFYFFLAYGIKDAWKVFLIIQFHAYLDVAAELELPLVELNCQLQKISNSIIALIINISGQS